MKKTGSRRALVMAARILDAKNAELQAILLAAAIQAGGQLLVRNASIARIDTDTDMAIMRGPEGILIESRGAAPAVKAESELTIREIPDDEPEPAHAAD